MKTTVEIPDDLFRRAKAKAALEGIPLRELIVRGLQFAMEQPAADEAHERVHFPLITGSPDAAPLTDQQVADALEQMAQEEIAHYASFM
jgi:hypothetical protein